MPDETDLSDDASDPRTPADPGLGKTPAETALPAEGGEAPSSLSDVLVTMGETYRANPVRAVRGQSFIKLLHSFIGGELERRLSASAIRRGIRVMYEGKILGSGKPKDVDVVVMDPDNGPLVLVGVRSQMSSVGKNVLTYYEGIRGECSSLQDRFPMSLHAYLYLHPLAAIKEGLEAEAIDHARYAKLYAHITGRAGLRWETINGIFDEFGYMIVDFAADPPELHDEIVRKAVPAVDLSIATFVDRIVTKYSERDVFWDVFAAREG